MDLVSANVEKEHMARSNHHRNSSALLVIDVQQGLFDKSVPIFRADQLLENINSLIVRAHQAGAPIVFIQHSNNKFLAYGSPAWQLHPRLVPELADCIIHKLHGNAFEATELDELLKARQVNRLVVSGLVTHGCVQATCLGALHLGYQVVLVMDAHSNYHRKAATIIEEWNRRLAAEQVEVVPAAAIEFV